MKISIDGVVYEVDFTRDGETWIARSRGRGGRLVEAAGDYPTEALDGAMNLIADVAQGVIRDAEEDA